MSNSQHDKSVDARISRVEVIVEGLATDVSNLATAVNKYVSTSGKTNWGLIFSGVSVIAAAVLWVITSQISPLRESLSQKELIVQSLLSDVTEIKSSRYTESRGMELEDKFHQHQLEQAYADGYLKRQLENFENKLRRIP